MDKPTIQYALPTKFFRDRYSTLKLRNYRFISDFPVNLSSKPLNEVRIAVRPVKTLYKCSIPKSQKATSLLSKYSNTLRKIDYASKRSFFDVIDSDKRLSLLISQCKTLNSLDLRAHLENLTKGKAWTSLRALHKLKEVKLDLSNRSTNRLPLLLKKQFKSLELNFGSTQDVVPEHVENLGLNEDSIALSLKARQLSGFKSLKDKEIGQKLRKLLVYIDVFTETSHFKDIEKSLKDFTNLRSLNIFCQTTSSDFLVDVLAPVLSNPNTIQHLDYTGAFNGLSLQNFDYSIFPRHLISLNLDLRDKEVSSQSLRGFTSQLHNFKNLTRFQYKTWDILYANEFVSDLPHSMPALKYVDFDFGSIINPSEVSLELKLHLNSFLDWIISLPSLEDVTLIHPGFNLCYCNYLENCKVLPKLKRVVIFERCIIHDLTMCEVEYQDFDLSAVLKILLPETIEIFGFTLHMELFKPKVLDMLEERLLSCRRLTQIKIDMWMNILSEIHFFKLEKMCISLYNIASKSLKLNYYQLANKLTEDIAKKEHILKGFNYTELKIGNL